MMFNHGRKDYGSTVSTNSFSDTEVRDGNSTSNTLYSEDSPRNSFSMEEDQGDEPFKINSTTPITLWSDPLFRFFGFEQNPLVEHRSPDNSGELVRNSAAADLRLSMLSNFSTAYNVISISIALPIMKNIYSTLQLGDASLCSSALIAGMIVGQLIGGALGDVLGRHRAMAVVMTLQILSSLGSAFSVAVPGFATVFHVLACWRFILGLGCGGVYPLAATLTAESQMSSPKDRSKAVTLSFACQGIGYTAVPITAWILLSILGGSSDIAWRLLLGIGSIPGAVLTFLRIQNTRNHPRQRSYQTDKLDAIIIDVEQPQLAPTGTVHVVPVSLWSAIAVESDLVRKLLGTGGCWLLFDILFYGNTLFEPVVLEKAFGEGETVERTARDMLLLALMSLPGYFVSVYAVGRQSPRLIQLQGFLLMGILYLCIALFFQELAQVRMALLLVYGATFFFSNYGPNATCFLLPSMTFSRTCRSTLNGISAACGKAGALLGATIFVNASNDFGQVTVFWEPG